MNVGLKPWKGLLWFDNHLFVKTEDSNIRQIDASTWSTISEWSVPRDNHSWIALPQHGKFIVYSTKDNITFWDTSTHTQLALIPRSSENGPIAFSPDDRRLQLFDGKRTSLSRLFLLSKYVLRSSSVFPHLNIFPFLIHKEPDIRIGNAALEAWKGGQFKKADKLLTAAIPRSIGTAHHVLASRALVRARLQQWDTALVDAEKVFSLYSHTYIR